MKTETSLIAINMQEVREQLKEEHRRPSCVVLQADGKYWRHEQKAVKSKPLATLLTEKEALMVIEKGVTGQVQYYGSR
ncbi:hypothetical protein [Robertmurraya sp.]|uniref:hypothetical protein n=1 Tax=Robertmurraya sp. TaxID=2837525 RepID=UPI00370374A6